MVYFVVIVYLLVIVIYFERFKSNTANDFGLFLLSVFVPVFGFVIAVVYNWDRKRDVEITYEFDDARNELVDNSDNFLLKDGHSNFEANLVLENYKEARREIINFNKLSLGENSRLYQNALRSKDTEVSHMAAAALMKIKQKFEKELMLSNDAKINELERYILSLNEYVENRLISGKLKCSLIENASNLVEKVVRFRSNNLEYYIAYVNLLLVVNNFDLALDYAYYLKVNWPYNDKVWLCLFNCLAKSKNRKDLLRYIDEYKNRGFEMSKEIEDFMLFWSNIED